MKHEGEEAVTQELFEWDQAKAQRNLVKHNVSFEEASSIFKDPLYIDFYDPDHSEREERYIAIGLSVNKRILLVSYTEREDRIRLISAREATRKEKKDYEEG